MSIIVSEAALRDYLLAHDDRYRELANEHKKYEARLNELSSLSYPNDEELIEETILKRKKLLLKDQMEAIVSRCRVAYIEGGYGNLGDTLGRHDTRHEEAYLPLEDTILKTELVYEESSGMSEAHSLPDVPSMETETVYEEYPVDLDMRLTSPPMPMQKIKVKLNFIGNETPRISCDPDND